jgi:hypothetical protein
MLNYAQTKDQLRSITLKRKINYAQEDGSITLNYAQTKDQLRSRGWLNYVQEDGNPSRTLYEIP